MKITSVRVSPTASSNGRLRAYVSVTFDECFAVHGMKIVEIPRGLCLAMPSRRSSNEYIDIVHPIAAGFRRELETAVFAEWDRLNEPKEEAS